MKTLVAGLSGTTFMTASSALMSLLPNEEFREPEQLSKLIGRLVPWLSGSSKVIAGWGAHYAMGFLFAAVYVELWEKNKIKHTIQNGLILGILSGILGMLIWKATFKVHPLPPNKRKLDFYLQRIPAHIIFAVFATLGYAKINQLEQSKVNDEQAANLDSISSKTITR